MGFVIKNRLPHLVGFAAVLCFSVACGQKNSTQNAPSPLTGPGASTMIPSERCESVSTFEKQNPVSRHIHEFYTMAEDATRFPILSDQNVYVVGDIHGSWQMIQNALVNAEIMEFESHATKNVNVIYNGSNVSVTIPNLKFKNQPVNKVIFVGDYIGKSNPGDEQKTLGLLNDVLEKQRSISQSEYVIAILGNHDFEAVNGVVHRGYPTEKSFEAQVKSMVEAQFLIPTYYYNGIWYSHSYLTKHDMEEFHGAHVNINFSSIIHPGQLPQLFQLSQQANNFIRGLVSANTVRNFWLESASENRDANFFYAMRSEPTEGLPGTSHGPFQKFPIIMGHLSDLERKVNRVLTENFHGQNRNAFPNRSHILCVDTSIYNSYKQGSEATYLRIKYQASGTAPVDVQSCNVPTR